MDKGCFTDESCQADLETIGNLIGAIGFNSNHNEIPGLLKAVNEKRTWLSNIRNTKEDQVCKYILKTFLKLGRGPNIEEIAASFGLPSTQVQDYLGSLEGKDLIITENGTQVVAAYPFSGIPTSHKVILKDKEVYALCAIDALGIPLMVDEDALILSSCSYCQREIKLKIQDGNLSLEEPQEILVWLPEKEPCGCAADTHCTLINFFCSKEHIDMWRLENPEEIGYPVKLLNALQIGRFIFKDFLI